VSSVTYEPFGPDTGFKYGSGSSEARAFDQDYRLTNITDLGQIRRGEARLLENLSYAYDPTNNVQTITDAVTSGNSQSFSYDSLQRLSQAAGSYGSFGFTYDGDGNQLMQALGATTTNYGYGSDQLATISVGGVQTQAIGYTADGRMASLNPGIQTPSSQYITSLSYNQDAQLSAVNAGSGALASYTYDGFGQRLIKTVSGSYGEIYQYGQNGMLLEETNSSGVAQADYIYLNGRPVAVVNGSTLYFLHDDLLGTPQVASDNSENIQWQAGYEPFGTTTSVSGEIVQNLRLPGQYFDVESGWNHNGLRDYMTGLGRYAEPDPLGRLGSGNDLYVYVGNNPANFVDPLGLCAAMNSAPNNPTNKRNLFTCASEFASKYSIAGGLQALGIGTSGVGGFITNALGGNAFSGLTDLVTSIGTGEGGGHSVFYNMGQAVVAGPTQGLGAVAGRSLEGTPWGSGPADVATGAIVGTAVRTVTGAGESIQTLNGAASLASVGVDAAEDIVTGVGIAKLIYDAASYGVGLVHSY